MKAGLRYIEGLITEVELKDIQKDLNQRNIEFRYFNETGEIKACFDFDSPLNLFVSREIIMSGAGYDLMKAAALRILRIISEKTFYKIGPGTVEEKPSKLNIEGVLADGGTLNLTLEGHLSDEVQNNAINKAFELFKTEDAPKKVCGDRVHQEIMLGSYNESTNEWEVESRSEFVQKQIKKQNK